MKQEKLESIVSEKELEEMFEGANFGSKSKRDVVRYSLLKVACGYHNGFTSQSIINSLGLCSKNLKLTKKGQEYLYDSFENGPI